jgi:hypothetical protein
MDEDDQMAAEAHQQELEAQAIQEGRELMNQFRAECKEFDESNRQFWNRYTKLIREQAND